MALDPAQPADRKVAQSDLIGILDEEGIEAVLISGAEDLDSVDEDALPHVALLDMAAMRGAEARECVERCAGLELAVIGLVSPGQVANLDISLEISDFVVMPADPDELATRVKRALRQSRGAESDEALRIGDLVINPTTYEVSLKGRRVNLRFKEYELLRLLATNPGRVYTREALLNQIWGYDYFGGTRTVDVHIRRLRSKVEDAEHSFIETVWNVGYRFKDFQETS